MNAEIISVGDELLIGQVVNSNQAEIAELLESVGIAVKRMTTTGDTEEEILRTFGRALEEHDAVIVTGGLGPTHDDITRKAVCRFFNTDLVEHGPTLEHIQALFAARGGSLLPINRDQALVPRGCTVIPNPVGTAPGYLFHRERNVFVVLPGVPHEMRGMMESYVVPFFLERGTRATIHHRTLRTTGLPESLLAHRLGSVDEILSAGQGLTLAFLPSARGVRLRITGRGESLPEITAAIDEAERRIRKKVGKYIYAVEKEELEEVLGRLLVAQGLTIAVAESCTGGLILDRLTDVPGSSRYVERGYITYSNKSKTAELGVPEETIRTFGAVSEEVAVAMARGARSKSNADIGLSTTGIAGPMGGSAEKPVGLVWIGYADGQTSLAVKFHFGTDRRRIKERAAQAALELVRRKITKLE